MTSPQLANFRKRLERGAVRVSVTLDPALEPDAVAAWDALKARLGGQKPALLHLLRSSKEA